MECTPVKLVPVIPFATNFIPHFYQNKLLINVDAMIISHNEVRFLRVFLVSASDRVSSDGQTNVKPTNRRESGDL